MNKNGKKKSVTVLELIVVFIVIGLLMTIFTLVLNDTKERARHSAAFSEMSSIHLAIEAARSATGRTLVEIIGNNLHSNVCRIDDSLLQPKRINLRGVKSDHPCFVLQLNNLKRINEASGNMLNAFLGNPSGIRDPWGSPYVIDEVKNRDNECRFGYLRSAGRDGIVGTEDDIFVFLYSSHPACMDLVQ